VNKHLPLSVFLKIKWHYLCFVKVVSGSYIAPFLVGKAFFLEGFFFKKYYSANAKKIRSI